MTKCIVENQNILSIISEVTKDDNTADELCTEASGLLCQIKRHHFFETRKLLVLGVLKPANAILQSQSVDTCSASEVVGAAMEALKKFVKCWAEVPHMAAGDDSHPVGHTESDDPTLNPHQSLKDRCSTSLTGLFQKLKPDFPRKIT